MPYALRTRIKKEIVAEFLPPMRKSNKVAILCGGMPGYPARKELMFFLAEKNFWVFSPRYRGSWESDGSFLEKSPHLDVIDVMDSLSSGFTDLWNNKKYKIKDPRIYLIGSSFGGPAAILASKDTRVKKIIALSPVVDWRVKSKIEPLDWLGKFTRVAFGNGYRFRQKDWDRLKSGTFYNPVSELGGLDRSKIYIIHAKDDEVVPIKPVIKFAKALGCKITVLKKGGHLSSSNLMRAVFWKRVNKFLKG